MSRVVYKSQIKGAFRGWTGHSIYELCNGQIWEQSQYSYHYHYAYRPEVKILESNGGYEMLVEGLDFKVPVKKIR